MLYNVLIIDDDRRTADSLGAQVGVLGHTVAIAYGPRMAMRQLGEVIPDVILLDLNMPGVNGLEVLRFLRRDPPTAFVPVIVITANDSQEMRRAARDAGANFYMVKPPMLDDIERALDRAVSLNPPPSGHGGPP